MTSGAHVRVPDEAILLCGGRSERMGRDKALLEIEGETMFARAVRTLAERYRRVLVSVAATGPSEELASEIERAQRRLGDCELVAVPDRRSEQAGPLAGLEAGLLALAGETAFLVAVDIAVIDSDLIDVLERRAEQSESAAFVPRSDSSVEPVFALYARSLLPRVTEALDANRRSLRKFAELDEVEVVDVEGFEQVFTQLNTPKEFESYRSSRDDG